MSDAALKIKGMTMRYRAMCVIQGEDYAALIIKLKKLNATIIDVFDKEENKWLKGKINA